MRVAMFMKWEVSSVDEYDQVRKVVDWDNKIPEGAVLHVASFDSKGFLRVTDVWESEEELNNFVQKRLMPGVEQVGIKTQPIVEVYPLHNLFTLGV